MAKKKVRSGSPWKAEAGGSGFETILSDIGSQGQARLHEKSVRKRLT